MTIGWTTFDQAYKGDSVAIVIVELCHFVRSSRKWILGPETGEIGGQGM